MPRRKKAARAGAAEPEAAVAVDVPSRSMRSRRAASASVAAPVPTAAAVAAEMVKVTRKRKAAVLAAASSSVDGDTHMPHDLITATDAAAAAAVAVDVSAPVPAPKPKRGGGKKAGTGETVAPAAEEHAETVPKPAGKKTKVSAASAAKTAGRKGKVSAAGDDRKSDSAAAVAAAAASDGRDGPADTDTDAAAVAGPSTAAGIPKQVEAPAYGRPPAGTLKLISWNVASLRACLEKGFRQYIAREQPDIVCLQETKLNADLEGECQLEGYHAEFYHADKSGYAGTAVYSRARPMAVMRGLGQARFDSEGRILTLEFPEFYLVNAYVPNAGMKLERLDYKVEFDAAFLAFLRTLDGKKPVVVCGDLNVAHSEADVYEPEKKSKIAGFTPQERRDFGVLLQAGFIDTFRHLHPAARDCYCFWSYRIRGRDANKGWRLDYFLVSQRVRDRVAAAFMRTEVLGSDHCPVGLLYRLA